MAAGGPDAEPTSNEKGRDDVVAPLSGTLPQAASGDPA